MFSIPPLHKMFRPFLCVCVSLILLVVVPSLASAQMGFIGTAIEAFSPCPNGAVAMSREIGGPPNTENYWDGAVSLKDWPEIPEVRVSLTVDNPAKIEIVSEI